MPEITILQSTEIGNQGLKSYVVKLIDGESECIFELRFFSKTAPGFGAANVSRVEAREIKPTVLQRILGDKEE